MKTGSLNIQAARRCTYKFSVFRSNWNAFFSNVGIPMVAMLKEKGIVESYYIELAEQGVVYSFAAKPENIELLSKFLSIYIESASSIPELSIQIHPFPFDNEAMGKVLFPEQAFYLGEQISDIIMFLFSSRCIDDDFTLSTSLLLHLGWIKGRTNACNESLASIILKGYCWFLPSEEYLAMVDELQNLYDLNSDTLMETVNSVFTWKVDEFDGKNWVHQWIRLCERNIYKMMGDYFNREYMLDIAYYTIPNIINRQLGLSKKSILLQCFYLNNSIIRFQKGKLNTEDNTYI